MRYRKLALDENDKGKSNLLLKLADECDRGILFTATWLSTWPCDIERPPRWQDGIRMGSGQSPMIYTRQRFQ
jgi:hypothetical protein